jgi:ABC-type multidrug transport system ATPase subunit
MKGRLRIRDRTSEREVELSRGISYIGSPLDGQLTVGSDVPDQSGLSLQWDPRHATWILQVAFALSMPASVNGRGINPGEEIPLSNLDTLVLPDAMIQFQRVLAPPMRAGHATSRIALDSQPLAIGRGDLQRTGDPNHIDLDPEEHVISRLHAVIECEADEYFIRDTSRTGTELNGRALVRERLVFGDRFRIAGYIFEFLGDAISRIEPELTGTITARDVTVVAGGNAILESVSLNIVAGEFIGVLGGSGQGKSTLLNALCGIRPPTAGDVRIGGLPLSDRERMREIGIGYVPQDDIVHKELTVTEAITFSARLRLKLSPRETRALVERVMARLGLAEHAAKRIWDLSGGQRKRVSIAIELLANPSVLFLDEPSSGLDPATEEALMTLLQSLTLTKLTVVCTTHVLQKAYLFDRLVFLQGGRLVFAGNSDEARSHFLLGDTEQETTGLELSPLERIYACLAKSDKPAAEWEAEFKESQFASRAFPFVAYRVAPETSDESLGQLRVPAIRSFALLVARQWRIVRSDLLNIAFLLVQPLLIGLLVGWVADKSAMRMFLCVVATMWFGCSNGAQQIVGELPIFRRERISGQGLNTYIFSKIGFLSLISVIQSLVLLVTTFAVAGLFHPEDIDRASAMTDLSRSYTLGADEAAFEQSGDEAFSAVDLEHPNVTPAPRIAQASAAPTKKPPSKFVLSALLSAGKFFQITQHILDSRPRLLTREDGTPLRDEKGKLVILPGISIATLFSANLGLRFAAVVAAAVVSVGIGLMISALVANTTQAVLWVPLVLIPQILLGGIVVQVPDMSRSVRVFSELMPSFAAQRIMDVGSLYGHAVPLLSNRTKTPVFLTSRGEKERVEWTDNGRSFSEVFDKLSLVNTSFQNVLVIPDRLGQHKRVGERSEDGLHMEYRDTVENRRDVRLSKGTIFRSLRPFETSGLVLVVWTAMSYGVIYLGLRSKQTRK